MCMQEAGRGQQNGRVYHDDHFNHGVLLSDASFPAPNEVNGKEMGAPTRQLTSGHEALRYSYTNGGTPVPITTGSPMPKWPVGHASAAFEAVVQKKALILSPAEIYAECTHHGKPPAGCMAMSVLLYMVPHHRHIRAHTRKGVCDGLTQIVTFTWHTLVPTTVDCGTLRIMACHTP